MNRLVCLRWISKTQRKENFSREARVAQVPFQAAEDKRPIDLIVIEVKK